METETAMNDESVMAGWNRCERAISGSWFRRHLHIAQVAPLYESVPPKRYGGTERVVAYLSEELVRRGHQVTLFASGNSTVATRIEAFRPVPLRAAGLAPWGNSLHLPMLSRVF